MKLLQRKEPVVVFLKESLLDSMDWFRINRIYKVKHYTVLYRGEEHIYINPDIEGGQRISEIITVLFKQKYLSQKAEQLLDEVEKLTDGDTINCLLNVWSEWRDKNCITRQKAY